MHDCTARQAASLYFILGNLMADWSALFYVEYNIQTFRSHTMHICVPVNIKQMTVQFAQKYQEIIQLTGKC